MAIGLLAAFVAGAAVAVLAIVTMMRSQMLLVETSPLGFDETVAAVETGVAGTAGWSSPATRDLNGMMRKHGVEFAPRVRLVEMCKAPYAAEVLEAERRVAPLLPCKVAVYEEDDGSVKLARMNIGLMAKVFGGKVGEIMGGRVAREEHDILRKVREPRSTSAAE